MKGLGCKAEALRFGESRSQGFAGQGLEHRVKFGVVLYGFFADQNAVCFEKSKYHV